jgi:hypothetical protein
MFVTLWKCVQDYLYEQIIFNGLPTTSKLIYKIKKNSKGNFLWDSLCSFLMKLQDGPKFLYVSSNVES